MGLSGEDEALARSAMMKKLDGSPPTVAEKRALQRWEKHNAEALRLEAYKAIPLRVWELASGRQAKVIKSQALRYGLPMGGPLINLFEFLPALHDFLAKHWIKFSAEASQADLMAGGGTSPALERYRNAQADLKELELAKQRREVLPRDEVRAGLLRIASVWKGGAENMARAFGEGCRQEFERLHEDVVAELERMYPETIDSGQLTVDSDAEAGVAAAVGKKKSKSKPKKDGKNDTNKSD